MNGEPYGFGLMCTWHGPLTFARIDDDLDVSGGWVYLCPKCGLELFTTTTESFWNATKTSEEAIPGYVDMLRWAQGKCFPDFTTMQNAWRQAMEGHW